MELLRIGDKLISRDRIARRIDRVLELRAQGMSQQDVAQELGIDRTLVSRLESLGEVRKGGKIALIGFPIGNKEEIERVAQEEGADFVLLMTDDERWDFVERLNGAELFNRLMALISQVKDYDAVIFLGSDMRIRLLEAVLGPDVVIGVELGKSPITTNCQVEPDTVRRLVRDLKI